MVDHLKECVILVSSRERISLALYNHNKEHLIVDAPSLDIMKFFSVASKALNLSHQQVCSDIKLVKKVNNKIFAKTIRTKSNELPTQV
jgi:hypothetical protein